MAINVANAAAAYARQANVGATTGMEARPDPGRSFASLVEDGLKSAVETGHQAERMSAAGIAGKADVADVVTAVNNAEITLQTVLAVRDRVIQAYQDIIKMPI